MQLLLVRHALPLRSEHGEGSDPDLSEDGLAQVARLPDGACQVSHLPGGEQPAAPGHPDRRTGRGGV